MKTLKTIYNQNAGLFGVFQIEFETIWDSKETD